MILSTISASQFESTKSVLLDRVEKYRTLLMNNEILPLSKQSKASYITGAIVLYLSIKVYSIFAYPSNLRHIKRMPVFTWLSSLIKGETAIQRTQRLLIPIWEEGNGMIAIYDQSGWTINVSNPEAVKTILYKTGTDILIHLPFHIAGAMTDQITDLYPKSGSTQRAKDGTLLRGFFGKMNLVLANGHEWMKRRKESMPKGINFGYIANPVFHRSMPVKTFSYLTEKMIRQIDDTEGPVALQPLLQRFTLDAIGLVGFGFEFNSIETPDGEWVNAYNDVANGIMDFRFLLFPSLDTTFVGLFPERQKKHNNLKKLNELFATVISHKKRVLSTDQSAGEENEKDLLTLMIEAGKNEGDGVEPLTDVELRNEIVVFFLAGHDTTSNTLTAALYFLAQNPSAQDKARKEIIDILGDGKADIGPTLDQIKELRFLNLVMKESIRFASPAQVLIERRAAQDTHLVGTFIPKGSLLRINILGLHYNSHLWKTPERFDPNRFSEGGEFENHPSAYSYLPFGGGARQCIGMNFSMAEQKVASSMILRKYELSVPDDSIHKEELQFTTNILFNFAKEVKLNFKRRY